MSRRETASTSSAGQAVEGEAGILRKKLYDQNLADWSARFRKNKTHLDNLSKECDHLRKDVAQEQAQVDGRAASLQALDEKCQNEVVAKFEQRKSEWEAAMQTKGMSQTQLGENRKFKSKFTQHKKTLISDHERKHAELMKTHEVHDKLDDQVSQLRQQLDQLTSDRSRMERELEEVQHTLRTNTDLAEEMHVEIAHARDGIKDSLELHMNGQSRMDSVNSLSRGFENGVVDDMEKGESLHPI